MRIKPAGDATWMWCGTCDRFVANRRTEEVKTDRPLAPMTWMQRLQRVLAIDIETCPKRGGKFRVNDCIENPDAIATILAPIRTREAAEPGLIEVPVGDMTSPWHVATVLPSSARAVSLCRGSCLKNFFGHEAQGVAVSRTHDEHGHRAVPPSLQPLADALPRPEQ